MCSHYLLRNIQILVANIARNTKKKRFLHKIDYKLTSEGKISIGNMKSSQSTNHIITHFTNIPHTHLWELSLY